MENHVAFYDPATGDVSGTHFIRFENLSKDVPFVPVPDGMQVDDVLALKVDLATLQLVNTGREPKREEVNAERDRRIAAGFPFAGKVIQWRPEDKARLTGAAALAGFAIGAGAQPGDYYWADPDDDPMEWITGDDSKLPLDAQTTFAMAQAGAKHEKKHVFAANKLKVQPRPVDYAENHHWPDYSNG